MFRLTCIVVAILATPLMSVAQKLSPTVKWGKEFDAPRRSSLNDIVGFDNSGIYAIKERYGFGNRRYTLEHYDKEFAPTKVFDLDLEENGKDVNVEKIFQLRGKLYLFSSFPNQRINKNILSVQEVNKTTLKPENAKRTIAEIDFNGSKSNTGDFTIRVSRDSSKVMVFYALPYNKNAPEVFGFHILNDALQPIWNKEVTMPFEDELFDIESTRVDNNGNVYLLGLIYKDRRKSKRRGLPNYTYQVFAYLDNGATSKEYPISLEDRFLTDMQIEILNDKNLICSGFYSELGTYSIRGTYFLTVDAITKKIKTKSFKEFGIDFITQNMTEREANRAERREERGQQEELYEYDLDKLLVGRDGSAMLIGEQYFYNVVTRTTYMNGMPQTTSTTHYYYNDIIVVKINAEGQIEWAEKVAKRQHTLDDGGFYSSYLMSIVKGRICFVFNDNPDNLGYTGVGRVFNYTGGNKSIVTLASIDEKGHQERQPLLRASDIDVIVRPKVCKQITSNNLILFGQRRKTQQFAMVSF